MTTPGLATKRLFHLIEFTYGDPDDPTIERYTERETSYDDSGDVYTAVPSLALKLPANTSMLDEGALALDVPATGMGVVEAHVRREPVSPTFVTVTRVLEPLTDDPQASGETEQRYVLARRWRVVKARANVNGQQELARLEARSLKARSLPTALGLPANAECVWTLGGRGCDLDLTSHIQTVTIVSVDADDRKKVTHSGFGAFTAPGGTAGAWAHRGYAVREGLRIGIRVWDPTEESGLILHLVDVCPASWVGEEVSVVPGCDKSIARCRERWDNEERFGGFGYAIRSYHSVHEIGTA